MKLNNKGFAISSVMYIILVLGVVIMVVTLALLSSRKLILDKLKNEVLDNIYTEENPTRSICKAVTELNKTVGTVPVNDYVTGERIYTPGDEYICTVKSGASYRFFVLNEGSETVGDNNRDIVNLIMFANITPTGEPITSSDLIGNSNIVWITEEDYGEGFGQHTADKKGPITAMNYLYNATKTWENLDNVNINYSDISYAGITTEGNITSIKMTNGTVTATYENLKARLPGDKELLVSCGSNICDSFPCAENGNIYNNACDKNPWIHNNTYNEINQYPILGIDGYWTMSTLNNIYGNEAIGTLANGDVWYYRPLYSPTTVGVRPVITVSKSDIS